MPKLRVFIAESVSAKNLYHGDREGDVVEAIVRLIRCEARHKLVVDRKRLQQAIQAAATDHYDVFHISAHGDGNGIELTDKTELSWDQLAESFEKAKWAPKALVMSSCVGGDKKIAGAFDGRRTRPEVIFGAEADDEDDLLSLAGACISWSILYGLLADRGMGRAVLKDAITKMNFVTPHRFVYRLGVGELYDPDRNAFELRQTGSFGGRARVRHD